MISEPNVTEYLHVSIDNINLIVCTMDLTENSQAKPYVFTPSRKQTCTKEQSRNF